MNHYPELNRIIIGIQPKKGVVMFKNLTLSQACEGMIRYKIATGKSTNTILDYRNTFKKLPLFFKDDPIFTSITRAQMIKFFAWLQEDYVSNPDGAARRKPKKLSPKTIKNIHTNLSALWTWAVNESLVEKNIIRTIDTPPTSEPIIIPFTQDELEALLKACDRSRTWKNRAAVTNARPTALRDRATILILVDTGIQDLQPLKSQPCDQI